MAQQLSGLGLDRAKLVLHVVGMDATGRVVLRKRVARRAVLPLIATLPPVLMGLEACGSAHDWARRVRAHGHAVRLIAPPFSKASVPSPQQDAREAAALGDAVTRPTRRFVPIKPLEPDDLQALPWVRERLIQARTALVHAIHGLLREEGMILPQGITMLRPLVVSQPKAEPATRTPLRREVFWPLDDEVLALEQRLADDDAKLTAMGQAHPACQRWQTIPGIGPVSATALIAAIGDVTQFKNGRQLAAWLGLVPREHSTGGTPRLLGSSKRGDR